MINLSLQGSMAVGKTTALRLIEKHDSTIHISYEKNKQVVDEIRNRKLDKNRYNDYIEIQRLFILNEVKRNQRASQYNCSIMDFGAEEIEFYTLNYPKAIGVDWEVAKPLEKELQLLKRCFPKRILYLNAANETLLERKKRDLSRNREFFDFYVQKLLPLKRKWFFNQDVVDVIEVDSKSEREVSDYVYDWIGLQLNK